MEPQHAALIWKPSRTFLFIFMKERNFSIVLDLLEELKKTSKNSHIHHKDPQRVYNIHKDNTVHHEESNITLSSSCSGRTLRHESDGFAGGFAQVTPKANRLFQVTRKRGALTRNHSDLSKSRAQDYQLYNSYIHLYFRCATRKVTVLDVAATCHSSSLTYRNTTSLCHLTSAAS